MDRLNVDVAAMTAIAAVRRPILQVCLAQERDAAVPAGAGVEVQLRFVGKIGHGVVVRGRVQPGPGCGCVGRPRGLGAAPSRATDRCAKARAGDAIGGK